MKKIPFNLKKDQELKILELLSLFFKKMDMKVTPEISTDKETVWINIKSETPSLLIGYRGSNLLALQLILRLMLSRAFKKPLKLMIDVDGYRAKQKEFLHNLARRIARKVRQTKRIEILRPMSAYERKIIHLTLAQEGDLITESVGEEPNRRVMVKLKK